jgi:hypothetical protein
VTNHGTPIALAAAAYFAVRAVTEGSAIEARRNAATVLRIERMLHLDIELGLQALLGRSDWLIDAANWIYIWAHWPVIVFTLVALAALNPQALTELRNAIFISGAVGLVIFATFAVAPPRLYAIEYLDTVAARSTSYRLLQPPSLINRYAAMPSFHFGWNLLVAMSWRSAVAGRLGFLIVPGMPVAMAFAVLATGNHWTLDVIVGGLIAVAALSAERWRVQLFSGGRPAASTRHHQDRNVALAPVARAVARQGSNGKSTG